MKTKREFLEERIFIENGKIDCFVDLIESAMEDYAEQQAKLFVLPDVIAMLPSDDEIEANGIEGGLRDGELQLFWEGGTWLKNHLLKLLKSEGN